MSGHQINRYKSGFIVSEKVSSTRIMKVKGIIGFFQKEFPVIQDVLEILGGKGRVFCSLIGEDHKEKAGMAQEALNWWKSYLLLNMSYWQCQFTYCLHYLHLIQSWIRLKNIGKRIRNTHLFLFIS